MKRVEFFIAGEPKGQPRPRAFVRGGTTLGFAPVSVELWKGQVALAAKDHLPPTPIETAIVVLLWFEMPRPQGHYGRRGLKPAAPTHHLARPDVDNLAKAVLDALVGIGFLRDDRLVCSLRVTKRYSNTVAGCHVRLAW